jgi:molybdopterin molybdotransferase
MRLDDALKLMKCRLDVVCSVETISVGQARGRVLADDVVASCAVPPHTNSAVDGYAVYHSDLKPDGETEFLVQDRVPAGHPLRGRAERGRALRVFTGAMIPEGSNGIGPDTVIMQEDCRSCGNRVFIPPGVPKGANMRPLGEDVAEGEIALSAGRRITTVDQALATAVGASRLHVYVRLKVALFSTGDEVCEPGSDLGPGQIYDANRIILSGFLHTLGCRVTDLGILPDKLEDCCSTIATAAQSHDLLISSGGVSVGEEDHIRAAILAHGRVDFWRLAIKPGRPLALGAVGTSDHVVPYLGLPGNPAAAIVTFMQFGRPLIMRLAGGQEPPPRLYPVLAGFSHQKKPNRREYLRCILNSRSDGQLVAQKAGQQGAGILSAMSAAEGLVELPEELEYLAVGATVQFLPFGEIG